jgi:hypothetical protein
MKRVIRAMRWIWQAERLRSGGTNGSRAVVKPEAKRWSALTDREWHQAFPFMQRHM